MEIKFRAWHPKHGYAFDVQRTYDSQPWPDACYYESFGALLSDPDSEGIVVEQFTGLKDKNGREIYKGDVCNCPDTSVDGSIIFHNGRFTWTDGACHWDMVYNAKDGNPKDSVLAEAEDLVVIGTIHDDQFKGGL